MLQETMQKMIPFVVKFSNFKIVKALKSGFIRTVPFTLVGSVFLLIANLPIPGYNEFMTGIFGANWAAPLNQVVGGTFNIIAVFAAFALAYEYCTEEGIDGVPSGLFGVAGLFIMTGSLVEFNGELISGAIPSVWLGGQGLIASVISSLLSGIVYSWFIKRDIRIKLPESVPPAVANSFSALIPGAAILTIFMILHIVINGLTGLSVTEAIYNWLQIPLQNLTDTLPGIIIVSILISVFWWCGIHGDAIILNILAPILQSNMLANQQVVEAGKELVVGENARIITDQFTLFLKMGGAGLTIGLVISMFIFAKSKQMKQLGKLAIGPAFFNINEPIIFGTPIIFNPVMLIPFIIVPTLSVIIGYFAISTGIVPPFTGVTVPWTMPPVLSGLVLGGWRLALLQLALVVMSVAIYTPFFKMQDKLICEQEKEAEAELDAE